MSDINKPSHKLIDSLQERAKELKCLYAVEELLNKPDVSLDEVFGEILQLIPDGLKYPKLCRARIEFEKHNCQSPDFKVSPWVIVADIIAQDKVDGQLFVYYTEELPPADEGPFLKEEVKLINTIADRLGHFVMYHRMKQAFHNLKQSKHTIIEERKEWRVALDLLRQTDRSLFLTISHKMLNYLCWSGIDEAMRLQQYYSLDQDAGSGDGLGESNIPFEKRTITDSSDFLSDETFKIAADHLSDDEILNVIQKWIQEDKVSFLVRTLNRNSTLAEVADAILRYYRMLPTGLDLPLASQKGMRVSLIRRFFSEQLEFINIAKNYIEIIDFHDILQNVIYTSESQGKLGGKTAGLLLAKQILKKTGDPELLGNVKTPKTWYITSDVVKYFMEYNNLEGVVEQKYKDVNQVRLEYPHIMQTFKNAHFPPEIVKGLSVALDDFKDRPLIVRSSSLLEDRLGAAFSGKYKSLFLANQGTKQKRMEALMDAIAEVYASVFGPDPVEYRAERGLLDFNEEMGIMIQEVVGTRVGYYYLPAFAGVAFSRNEFRWSPRIKREDGLIRMVLGLGTRAVDRVSDDYPILIAPGQSGLRANVTPDEIIRYSPKKVDVINLETNTFETIEIPDLLRDYGHDIPNINQIVSLCDGGHFRQPVGLNIDFDKKNLVVTFEGLISRTPFVGQIHSILKLLEEKIGSPVDIEFASDGKDFYLLQCRPQSHSEDGVAAPIPKDISEDRIIFSANKFISNGRVPDITHIVYVDPNIYSEISDRSDLLAIGRAVGHLNKLLPKRQFILMGPGRWGSRGDVKLGVSVTYSDINNTAVLIEIARKKGNYLPDLSFGTHFFQDLVEANIRYLPLYPDNPGIFFNDRFLCGSPNILSEILPEFAYLGDAVRLIDVPGSSRGQVLQILMNADLEEAIAILTQPKSRADQPGTRTDSNGEIPAGESWRWRLEMAAHLASHLDGDQFGVKGFYLFGSTKNATAGPASDIDILIHFVGNEDQKKLLNIWLEGWSLCLGEMNFLRTGYKTEDLLDVHIVTDEDIANKDSYASKIGAVTDAARPLPLKKKE
jgi:pyruvate,water dikinase